MLQDALKMNRVKREWPARLMLLRFIGRLLGQVLTGKRYVSAGAALQGQLLKACLAAGVDVRTSTPVTELLAAGGRIVGVRAGVNGGSITLSSKLGVLVDAGGFARNQALRDRYLPGTKTDWSNTVESDTGDLLEMMMALGADTEGLGLLLGYQSMIPPGKEGDMVKPGAQKQGAAPHSIVVDQTGVRYLNEGGSYVAFVKNMMDRNAENPGSALPSWIIMDSQAVNKYGIAGVKKKATLKKWVEAGYLKTADSPRSLAEALNMDPATLSSTIERFNGMVDKQCDDDFARGKRAYDQWLGDPYNAPNASLGRLEVGPFYAVPVLPGDVSTLGGVVTDVHARVLTPDGQVIPGLYATGVAAASPFGQVYPGAGASIGPAYTFAYIAANHALNANT
jgi:3-oxosteroid 1-dehydrogenase